MNKNILVTGGLGFIGSHFISTFDNPKYNIYIVDNLHNSKITTLDKLKKLTKSNLNFYQVDIRDCATLEKIFHDTDFDFIAHFAALKSITESLSKRDLYFDVNFNGSKNLINLAIKFNVKNFIFSSTAALYKSSESAVTEDSEIEATNPYSESKYQTELYIKKVSRNKNNTNFVVLRYFNPIGAHPSGLIGESLSDHQTNIMPSLIRAYKNNEEFTIFGKNYDTPDGTCLRDYIYIMDLALAHKYFICKKLQSNFSIYNVGTGKPTSVKELVDIFNNYFNDEISVRYTDRRKGDLSRIYADVTKIKNSSDWKPLYSTEDIFYSIRKFTRL